MRNIQIDLSSDNIHSTPSFICGLKGEHNETSISVTLPNRMISNDISYYYFKFELEDGTSLSSPQIFGVENQRVSVLLWQQITQYKKIKCNVIAENNIGGEPKIIAKSPTFLLVLQDSASGEDNIYNPVGNEDALQKAINMAIDNVKKQGFLLPAQTIECAEVIEILPNIEFTISPLTQDIDIQLGESVPGYSNEWIFIITQGGTAYDVVLPIVEWQLGIAPTFSANTTTEVRLYYIGNTLKGVWN